MTRALATAERLALAILLTGFGLHSAHAQESGRVQRPYRGLFGGTNPTADNRQALTLRLAPFGAYDRDYEGGNDPAAMPIDVNLGLEGGYSALDASIDYVRRGSILTLRGEFGTSGRYYPALENFLTLNRSAGIGVALDFQQRTNVQLQQRWRYAPFFSLGLFPDVATPELGSAAAVSPDYTITKRDVTAFETIGNVRRNLTNRSTLIADYSLSHTTFSGVFRDLTAHRAAVTISRQFTRRTMLSAGYRTQLGTFELPEEGLSRASTHQLVVGMEHTWLQSATRRPRLRLEGGPSMVHSRTWLPNVLGSLELDYPVARNWTASAAVRRTVGFVDGFGAPFLSQGGTVQLQGVMARRVELTLAGSYLRGQVENDESLDPLRSAVGSGRLAFAVSRNLALFGQYLFYYYDFGRNVGLPGEYVRALNRSGVRLGIDVWLPIFEQRRRDDSR